MRMSEHIEIILELVSDYNTFDVHFGND